jgi:nicotinamidase-related amidase
MKHDAIIVIDVQKALVEEHPYQEEVFISNLQKLITACRNKGIQVIYIRHGEAGSELEPGSQGWEIAEAISPKDGEKIFEKQYNSAFRQTGLHEHLQTVNIKKLILCGMQTEYCVDTTCKVAFELGYQATIPSAGTTTFDNRPYKAEELTVFYEQRIWNNRFARVIPMEALLTEINN